MQLTPQRLIPRQFHRQPSPVLWWRPAMAGVLLIVLPGLSGCEESVPQVEGVVVDLDETNFSQEVLSGDQPALVEFGTTWCGPCRQMEPLVAYLSVQREETLTVGRVDCDESGRLANEYQIEILPTFAIFRGGQEIARTGGSMSYRALTEWVDSSLSN